MANFIGTTVTDNVCRVKDVEKAREYIGKWYLGELNCEIADNGELSIWGYEWFDAYKYDEDGMTPIFDDNESEQFFEGLRDAYEARDIEKIQTIAREIAETVEKKKAVAV